jgi:uncharacterized protein YyaL (SSP411 family)
MASSPRIAWLQWGEEAFTRARIEHKPVLLRIGAFWCPSCRLMERDVDTDALVAAAIERDFVPIYVDTDLRPDVNERYNLGGWPTNSFLTPKGGLITGGTFFPVDTYRLLLDRVAKSWREKRGDIEDAIAASRREHDQRRRVRPASESPGVEALVYVADHTMDAFDFRFGGFGTQPKFTHTGSIELLLAEHLRTGEVRMRDAALICLESMAEPAPNRSALLDPAGGFFHYGARRDWSETHFEKLLVEHARLLSAYLSAHQLTGDPRWAEVSRSVVSFVDETLADYSRAVFRASQAGYGDPESPSSDASGRQEPKRAPVDPTAITSWNAEMASAYIKAGLVLGNDSHVEFGLAVTTRMCFDARLENDDPLLGHILEPDGGVEPVMLADQVYTARALVDAYEAAGDSTRLAMAAELLDAVHSRFLDTVRDAYTDIPIEQGAVGGLDQPLYPLAETSIAADTLLRLASHLDAPSLRQRAQSLLRAVAPIASDHPFIASHFALAVMRSLEADVLTIHIAGAEVSVEQSAALVRAAHAIYAPLKAVRFLEPERDHLRLRALKDYMDSAPLGVVCRGIRCAEPTSDATRLLALVARAAAVRLAKP